MADFNDLDLLKVGNTIQIVGAIWAGDGKMYLCLFPGEHGCVYPGDGQSTHFMAPGDGHETVVEELNMTLDEWTQFVRQTDIMEAEVIAEGPEGKPIKAIVRKSARQISQHVSWAVYRRDDYRCRYCGRDDVPLTVDHLVLWEEGGPNTEDNLVSACKKCNKTRGNTQYADWLGHPYYKKVSQNLPDHVRQENLELVPELADISRMLHKPTKRK